MNRILLPGALAVAAALALGASCHTSGDPAFLSREKLMDPETCKSCHADHFTDWSGSMHAYASDDPVFLAMNKRGQRETNGALGKFCVNCHAPMAVRTGATTDGLNLADVARPLKGVTCFFCHAVDDVQGTHNNPLHVSDDNVMRGPFKDPVANTAHRAAYSPLHDRDQLESAKLCGTCHDIVNDHGAAIERTYQEWQGTVFAHAPGGSTCGQCHMEQSATLVPIAQAPGVKSRRFHGHAFPGVDVALTPFAETATQKKKVQALLDTTLQTAVCVGGKQLHVIVDNVAAGHGWPSGSGQDRRAWIELVAYANGQVVYQTGVVPDGGTPLAVPNDPDLWLLRDCMLDDKGAEVKMFWQAQSFESNQLIGQLTFDTLDPRFYQTHIYQSFPRRSAIGAAPDRVTMRVRLQPMGLDVLDDLVASKDLDPAVRAAMPILDVGATLEWTPATATEGYFDTGVAFKCVSNTNLNFQADKVLTKPHVKCAP